MSAVAVCCLAVVLLPLTGSAAKSAAIKTRDGKTTNGELQGQVLVKDSTIVYQDSNDRIELARYTLVDGKNVVAVDEGGAQLDSAWLTVGVAARRGGALQDSDVVAALCDVLSSGDPTASQYVSGASGTGSLAIMSPPAETRVPLSERGSLAIVPIRILLSGFGSPSATNVGGGFAMRSRQDLAIDSATMRFAGRLAAGQDDVFNEHLQAAKNATGQKKFVLADEVLGELFTQRAKGKPFECSLRTTLRVTNLSGTSEIAVADLPRGAAASAPDALGGLTPHDALYSRLDEFFGLDRAGPAADAPGSKTSRPRFDYAVITPLVSDGLDVPPDAATTFETELAARLLKKGFKGVFRGSQAPPADGLVLEVSALATKVRARSVVACKGVDRSSGRVMATGSAAVTLPGARGPLKEMSDAAVVCSRTLEARP